MIGITSLAAMTQLLRLMATTRSKASSVICSSSASPPEQADADIVVEDVDPAPARLRVGDHRLDVGR